MMRLGYVLNKFPKLSETFILNEMLELRRQGAQITVFSLSLPDEGHFHPDVCALDAEVVYVGLARSSELLSSLRSHLPVVRGWWNEIGEEMAKLVMAEGNDVWRTLRCGTEVALHVRDRGIERLHAHFASHSAEVARVASTLAKVPFGFTCHAKDIYHQTVDARHFEVLCRHADPVITVCEANRVYIEDVLLGNPLASLRVLYNGIDLEKFHPRNRQITPRPLVLGVGRLIEKKGFRYLIEAAASLEQEGHDFECVVVGEGRERASLEARIEELGIKSVRLIGARRQDEVRDLLSRATMLVLPCVVAEDGNRDALPTVLLEAMAAGVPVVSTPVTGVEEIIELGRSGLLVPPRDVAGLRAAMAGLLSSPEQRALFSKAGRKRAEQLFDLQHNVAALIEHFGNGARSRVSVS